ncbi:MAG: hypothetical protein HS130_00950 [Deltaproteobacteria bacterium]|nr:hypothetical protein [Deltaproteobacteria bacterium]MCL4873845.1 hypothetical protein [bacterium]
MARKVKSLEEKEEAVLARAVAQTMKAYNESPTMKNLKEWDAARKRFDEFQKRKAADADPEARRFANLLEVLGYLTDEGWKVAKSKLYADQNKISKERDGAYAKKAVDEYARLALVKLDGSGQEDEGLATRKAKIELDILEEKKKRERRENEIDEGKWVLRSDVESMLAGRAALLKSGLGEEFIHARAARIIDLVGGDQAKAPDLIALWKEEMEEHFNRYSEPLEFAAPAGGNLKAEEEEGG